MGYLTEADWSEYTSIINEFHDDAFQQDIIWKRPTSFINKFMETKQKFIQSTLKCLVQYNSFRSWPINEQTNTGEIDKESCLVYFNMDYLRTLGFINDNNQFTFDAERDRFIIDGILYKPAGDSKAAQANNKTLFTFIILKREERGSHENIY